MGSLLSTMGDVATNSIQAAATQDLGSAGFNLVPAKGAEQATAQAVNPIDVIRQQMLGNIIDPRISGNQVVTHGIGGFFSGSPEIKPVGTPATPVANTPVEEDTGSTDKPGNTGGRPSELTWEPGRTLEPGEVIHGPQGQRMEAGNGRSGNRDQFDQWGNINTGVWTPAAEDTKKPTTETPVNKPAPVYLFADGGEVPERNLLQQLFPQNIFDRTRQRREEEAGTSSGITINVNSGGSKKQEDQQDSPTAVDMRARQILDFIRQSAGFQNGGQVPEDTQKLHSAINKAAAGGNVRSGQSDVAAGGVIRGPESKTGRDNQVIGVGGGEGILPKDVMDVPGVSDLVQTLIQTFHKPVK